MLLASGCDLSQNTEHEVSPPSPIGRSEKRHCLHQSLYDLSLQVPDTEASTIYHNERLGFNIQYPKQFSILTENPFGILLVEGKDIEDKNRKVISINTEARAIKNSHIENYFAENINNRPEYTSLDYSFKEYAGLKGIFYSGTLPHDRCEEGFLFEQGDQFYIIHIDYPNTVSEEHLENMLATFRFTNNGSLAH